jgi:nitroreductase
VGAKAPDKHLATRVPVHSLLSERWSPRAFADRDVPTETVLALFEAVRLAPSCFNEQPWRYFVGMRQESAAHARVLSCLVPWNQGWAKSAPLLLIGVASLRFERNGKPNKHAFHDLGLASMSLVVEAAAHGLVTHQMGGIDVELTRRTFEIPEGFEPLTAIAAGFLGDPDTLDATYADDERAPRRRRELESMFFGASWGEPASALR